jgi:hypothetical protein
MIEMKDQATTTRILTSPAPWSWYDPLGDDAADDARVETSKRGLVRLALAAAQVGARFERDGVDVDPAAWLLAPRRVFDGECAIEACVDLAPFRRCVMLHAPGVDVGMDADPEDLDRVLENEPAAQAEMSSARRPRRDRSGLPFSFAQTDGAGWSGPRLYSCSMTRVEPGARVATFVAGVAPDERDFRRRLFERFGAMAALNPDVRVGFDQYDPVVATLVSERLADWLAMVSAEPFRCGDSDFEVVVEHRTRA